MRNILFAALLCSGVVWAQNPNVPVAQNALGTIGYYANSSSGTAINKIVTFTGAPSKVVTITAGATGGAIGIISGGAGTAGNATVQITGYNVPCVFDGATTAGDYVSISASVNGDCTDAGASAPSSQSLGIVLSTNASGGTFKIDMASSSGGGSSGGVSSVATGNCLTGGTITTTGTVSFNGPILSKTTNYQVLAADFSACSVIMVPSGSPTITLVASGSQPAAGQYIWVVNYGSGAPTIVRSGQNINGSTSSITLLPGNAASTTSALIWSDGSDYFSKFDDGITLEAMSATDLQGVTTSSIPYQTGLATTGYISPVNSALVVTSAGGVPSEGTALPNGITATTQAATDTSTNVASDAFVQTAVSGAAATIKKVSQLIPLADATAGCNAYTGLNNASAPCADDQSYINAFLATATIANPVKLIYDVSIGISKCLISPYQSNVTHEGLGMYQTGVFVLNGSNISAIGTATAGSGTGASVCGQALLTGSAPSITTGSSLIVHNLLINGNRGTNLSNGNSSSGDVRCQGTLTPSYGWCVGIMSANLAYLEVSNVLFLHEPTYGSFSSNVTFQRYKAVECHPLTHTDSNTDCIHMTGPAGRFEIDGVEAYTGDDLIAANMPEGYGGTISGGVISNVNTDDALTLFHTYCGSSGGYSLGQVAITNFEGSLGPGSGVTGPALIRLGVPGLVSAGGTDCIQNIHVSNSTVYLSNFSNNPQMADLADNSGDIEFSNVTWYGPSSATPWFLAENSTTASNVVCTQCNIYQTSFGSAAAFWAQSTSGSSFKRLEFNGANVTVEQGQSPATVSYALDIQSGSTVGTLRQDTCLTGPFVTSLFNGSQASRVTTIAGCYQSGNLGTNNLTPAGSGTRALGTVYQNLLPVTLNVNFSCLSTGVNQVAAQTDSSATPALYVAFTYQTGISIWAGFSFPVLPNNYYEISAGGCNVTTSNAGTVWIESTN